MIVTLALLAGGALLQALVAVRIYDLRHTRHLWPSDLWQASNFVLSACALLLLVRVLRVGGGYERFAAILLLIYPLFVIGSYTHWAIREHLRVYLP